MVIVRFVLQPPLCGIGCWQILEMRRLLEILSLLKTHLFKVAFTDKELLSFKSLQGFYRHII